MSRSPFRLFVVSPAAFTAGLAVLVSLIVLLALPRLARAGGVVGDGTAGSCTHAALSSALNSAGTITFNCPAPYVITLTQSLYNWAGPTTIDGANGGHPITLSGDGTFRLFGSSNGYAFTLANLKLANGYAAGDQGGAIYNENGPLAVSNVTFENNRAESGGGAIYNDGGTVTIANSTFYNNTTTGSSDYIFGGAMYHRGTGASLAVTGSTFDHNSVPSSLGAGGAIYVRSGATLAVVNSTFTANSTPDGWAGAIFFNGASGSFSNSTFEANTTGGSGGAVDVQGSSGSLAISNCIFKDNVGGDQGGALNTIWPVTVSNSTFSGNRVTGSNTVEDNGGAIYNGSSLTIANSTFYSNTTGARGGAIHNAAGKSTGLINSTLAENSAGSGGPSLYNETGGVMTLTNTLVARSASGNCAGAAVTEGVAGSNLEGPAGSTSCGFSRTPANPALVSPANNGGATLTMALPPNSPAIDAGDNAACAAAPANNLDQRGFSRPKDGDGSGEAACDIGAYEAPAVGLAVTKQASPNPAEVGQLVTYTYRVTNTGEISLTSIVATDDRLGQVSLNPAGLGPGQSASGSLNYTVLAGDRPGPLQNTVTVSGTVTGTTYLVTGAAQAVVGIPELILVDPGLSEAQVITTTGSQLVVQIPPDVLPPAAARLKYTALGLTPTNPVGDETAVAFVFELDLLDGSGQVIPDPQFATPLVMTLTYDPSALGGVSEANLGVFFYDEDTGDWVSLPVVSRNTAANTLTFEISHLTQIAVLDSQNSLYLPTIFKDSK